MRQTEYLNENTRGQFQFPVFTHTYALTKT